MTALIHIGYHKTGTNWFQRCLYPAMRGHAYVRRAVVRSAFLDVGTFAFDPGIAEASFRELDAPAILCEEELSGNIHSGGLAGALSKDICERLHRVFPDATVTLLVRNQVDMIASVYLQYVKEGGTHRLDRYLQPRRYLHHSGFRQAKAAYFSFDHFDYWPLVEHYRQTFGPERVKVFAFEDFVADTPAFVERFARELGLNVDWEGVRFGSVNPPYRRNTIRLARVLNRFTYRDVADKRYWLDIPRFFRARGKLLRAFNRTPLAGDKWQARELLGPAWVEYIEQRYARGNAQLAKRCELPLGELGYPVSEGAALP